MKRKITLGGLLILFLLADSRVVLAAGLVLEFGGKPELHFGASPRMAEAENVKIHSSTVPMMVQGGSEVFTAELAPGSRVVTRDVRAGGAGGSEDAKAIFVIAIGALLIAGCVLLIAGAVSSS